MPKIDGPHIAAAARHKRFAEIIVIDDGAMVADIIAAAAQGERPANRVVDLGFELVARGTG